MLTSKNILELVGNTPIVKVNHLDCGPCELFLKLENQNPGGSIKDRIALFMINAAEKTGQIKPGGTLVEATSGNTGVALALVASQMGYKLILVIPDKTSVEKIAHVKALGAQVILTRSDIGKGHPDYYHDKAERIAREHGAFYVNQFENPNNPIAHEQSTGPELWEQMNHHMDAIVCGAGTGGTLTGLARYFNKVQPKLEMILADPMGSVYGPYVQNGTLIQSGRWMAEGIGKDFIPKTFDIARVTQSYSIDDGEGISTAHDVLRYEGIMCGFSSGTLIAAALRYCRAQTIPKRVVSFVCDSGYKYLSKIYNRDWLHQHGFSISEKTTV
ncbi:MAG: PLP-dependent cysteine synthase family protein [Alphaproteobacteria bacterium]|nr:PLP-dependent cysteine synthase family protein [Alphaproteobacteria bacterium]